MINEEVESNLTLKDDFHNIFDIPVIKPQIHRILRNCGFIDPDNIRHYIAMNVIMD
jgi:hypothetical protein